MLWLSLDPGASAGLARWHGNALHSVATIFEPTTQKARKAYNVQKGGLVMQTLLAGSDARLTTAFASEVALWTTLIAGSRAVIAEEGFGAHKLTIKQHAHRRGYVHALCDERAIPFHEVNVQEWRKVVGKANGFTFPNDSELAKARAMELVEARFGQRVGDDEADAVCAGLWALETRTVRA